MSAADAEVPQCGTILGAGVTNASCDDFFFGAVKGTAGNKHRAISRVEGKATIKPHPTINASRSEVAE